ncbi:notch-like transmembrane receptor, partial [Aphelenchoides avenae]
GKTPLILAIESVLEDIACLLLDRGADPNVPDSRYWTPLHHSVKMLSSRLVEKLLANGTVDIEATTDEGETPLLICAREGKPAALYIAPILLKRKANPDGVGDIWLHSNRKRTPLHWAAELNNELMVKALVESGANRNAQDADGRTPLFLAANNGSDSATRMLLLLHADSTIADVDDKTPLRAAHEKCFDSVVKVFEEHKATKTNTASGLPKPPQKCRRLKQSPPMYATKVVAKQHSSSAIKLPNPIAYQPAYASHPYMPPAAAYGVDFHNMARHQQWNASQQGSTVSMPHAPNNNAWATQSPHHQHTGLSPMFLSWLPMRDERPTRLLHAARPAPPATFHASPQDARGVPVGSAPQGASPQMTSCADKPAPNGPQQTPPAAVEKNDFETLVAPQSSVMLTPPSESKRRRSSGAVKPEPKHDGGTEVLDEFFAQHPYNVTQLLSL